MTASRYRFLGVLVLAFLLGRVLSAQSPCYSDTGGLLHKGTLDPNTGIRTINVALPPVTNGSPTVSQGTRDAMEAALGAWNAKTSDTKIHFEPKEYSQQSDIKFVQDNAGLAANGSLCAGGQTGGDVKFDSYMSTLGENPTATLIEGGRTKSQIIQQVFTHELGHVLNLKDISASTPSIMNQATGGSDCQDALTNHLPATNAIQDDDATHAKDCANKGDPIPDGGGGFGDALENQDCWDVYWVTYWYYMNEAGDWQFYGADWEYLYTTCEPPF